jgi:hypothetical protein
VSLLPIFPHARQLLYMEAKDIQIVHRRSDARANASKDIHMMRIIAGLLLAIAATHAASTQRPYAGAALSVLVEPQHVHRSEPPHGRANASASALVDSDHSGDVANEVRSRTLRPSPEPTSDDRTLAAFANPFQLPSPPPSPSPSPPPQSDWGGRVTNPFQLPSPPPPASPQSGLGGVTNPFQLPSPPPSQFLPLIPGTSDNSGGSGPGGIANPSTGPFGPSTKTGVPHTPDRDRRERRK